MKKLIVLVLTVALLSCSLTSCVPAMVGGLMASLPDDDCPDLDYIANNIAPDAVRATVQVNASFTGSIGTQMAVNYFSQGSGVIIRATSTLYYLLTNAHVLKEEGRTLFSVSVTDAYGNDYSAHVIDIDSSYDLALLTIRKGNEELAVTPLAEENAESGDTVFSVGCPNGLKNLVTYGEVISYTELDDDGVDFPILAHSAPTDGGSSGGGLFDCEGRLVGINFAGGENVENEKKYYFSIPLENVIAFLAKNGYTIE